MPPTSHARGIALYLAGVALFAANDALGKFLVTDYGVAQLLLVRSLGAGVLVFVLARVTGATLRLPRGEWWLHAVRVLLLAADSFCFYYATRALPLADVMTFYMSAPLLITAASALLLGEQVGVKRWAAIVLGFIGVVIALQPTSAAFSPSALVALFGAACFALALVITRRLRDCHWVTLAAWQFIGGGILGAVLSPLRWTTPGLVDFGLMALVGLVACGCFMLITRAISMAPASLLAPFQYSAILWATILGWIFWQDTPTPPILLGNAIIIGSGLFVLYRERVLKVAVNDQIEPIP